MLSSAQKAYEMVSYSGKLNGIIIKLNLADGYIGASEIKIKDTKTGKPVVYIPESGTVGDSRQLKFSPLGTTKSASNGYFILEKVEDVYDELPGTISADYYKAGKRNQIKFYKVK
ncbi:hypothetical protein ACXZ1K_13315 [Pedobacter sp. PWIIR3]